MAWLAGVDITPEQWTRWWFGADAAEWLGDACGCTDDRCAGDGWHHPVDAACGCRAAMLDEIEGERLIAQVLGSGKADRADEHERR